MQFEHLSLTNFLSFGQADIKLANRGLLLIQGVNRENGGASSNGSGKSSLVDAIFWCLYGKTARGVGTDDVINNAAGKECRVVLTIKDGDDEYLIARHRKHSKHKNRLTVLQNGTDITMGTDKQTQELVNRIVGSSESVFANSVYAGQEAMPDLPMRTDKELKALVEEAAGIDRLNAAYQAQRDKANLVKRELDAQQATVDKLTAQLQSYRDQLTRFEDTENQWSVDQKLKMDRCKSNAKAYKDKYAAMDVAGLQDNKATLESRLAEVRKRIDATEEERKHKATLQWEANDADTKARYAETKARDAGENVKKVKLALENVDGLVGSPCGECGKPYHEHDLDDARSLRKKALAEAVAEFKRLKSAMEEARDRSRIAQETLASFEHTMTSISDETRSEREISSLLADVEVSLTNASHLKMQVEAEVENYKRIMAEPSPYASMIDQAKRDILATHEHLEDERKKLKAISHKLSVATLAVEVLGTSGVRAHILDHVTPILNERTSHYLGQLSEGEISATWQTISATKAGELRDKFAINVVNTKGAKSFGGLSGGEKRKVRIATAMALQDLVATRSAKSLPLFIFDEIDHALDADGLERLMSIMKEKATKSGTVLVISHNDLNHYISDSIRVVKEHGLSQLEV